MTGLEITVVLAAFAAGFAVIWYLMNRSASESRAQQLIDRVAAGSLTPQQILGAASDAAAAELERARDQRLAEIGADAPAILTSQETALRRRAAELVEQAYQQAIRSLPPPAS